MHLFYQVLAGNQKGFARAIEKSGVPRDEFFICGSVLSNLAQAQLAPGVSPNVVRVLSAWLQYEV